MMHALGERLLEPLEFGQNQVHRRDAENAKVDSFLLSAPFSLPTFRRQGKKPGCLALFAPG
jgi:hypothetical protein